MVTSLPKELERFGQTVLEENPQKGGAVPTLPLFGEIDALLASRPGIPGSHPAAGGQGGAQPNAGEQAPGPSASFDDLLRDLDGALGSGLGSGCANASAPPTGSP